jgi:hypothetical protein
MRLLLGPGSLALVLWLGASSSAQEQGQQRQQGHAPPEFGAGIFDDDFAGLTFGDGGAVQQRQGRGAMQLVMMSDKGLGTDAGAVCLDGSDAGFYFSPGRWNTVHVCQISLPGGGWSVVSRPCSACFPLVLA